MSHQQTYVPALGSDRLTPLYDAAMASIFQEQRLRMPLVNAMHVLPDERVLDIGCGTATLSLLLEQHTGAGLVAGMDIDPVMLAVAQRKVARAGAFVSLACGSADALPYANESFGHVVSSLMLHHLATLQKQAMLAEAHRVLKPGGRILIMDFGPVGTGVVAHAVATLLGRFEHVNDNLHGRVPGYLVQSGFVDVEVAAVAFGGVVKLFMGRRPVAA